MNKYIILLLTILLFNSCNDDSDEPKGKGELVQTFYFNSYWDEVSGKITNSNGGKLLIFENQIELYYDSNALAYPIRLEQEFLNNKSEGYVGIIGGSIESNEEVTLDISSFGDQWYYPIEEKDNIQLFPDDAVVLFSRRGTYDSSINNRIHLFINQSTPEVSTGTNHNMMLGEFAFSHCKVTESGYSGESTKYEKLDLSGSVEVKPTYIQMRYDDGIGLKVHVNEFFKVEKIYGIIGVWSTDPEMKVIYWFLQDETGKFNTIRYSYNVKYKNYSHVGTTNYYFNLVN